MASGRRSLALESRQPSGRRRLHACIRRRRPRAGHHAQRQHRPHRDCQVEVVSKIVPNPSRSDKPLASGAKVVRMEVGQDSAKARADLVFVIDTTGSMNDKIDGLIESCQSFVDRLASRRIDWVAAVVGFGDLTVEGDRIVATPSSSSRDRVKALLRGLPRYSGGGNEGESSLEALQAALSQPGYRPGAMKVLVLITDEPALQRTLRPSTITGALREAGAMTFVLSPKVNYFRSMAA